MANVFDATRYSDIVLGKVDSSDQGYSFLEMDIAFTAPMKAGMIVNEQGVPVAAADATTAYGVLLDRDLLPNVVNGLVAGEELVVGETYNFVVGVRGLTLNKFKLVFANGTTAINDAAIDALQTRGLKITDHYFDGTTKIAIPQA